MKYLKVFVWVIILAFSTAIMAQEKETEKPKEADKPKDVEKPKDDLSKFRTSRDSGNFLIPFTPRPRKQGTPPIPNQPADVTEVELVFENNFDDESDTNLCFPDKGLHIEIITKAKDKEDDTLTYSYTVSGGRVIGVGKKVTWDLSGVKPGTYTITAAVDDGCGYCGKTMTKTVTVKE